MQGTGLNPHPGNGTATAKWNRAQVQQLASNNKAMLKLEAQRELLGLVEEIDAMSGAQIMGHIMRHSADERAKAIAHSALSNQAQQDKPEINYVQREVLEDFREAMREVLMSYPEEVAEASAAAFDAGWRVVVEKYGLVTDLP